MGELLLTVFMVVLLWGGRFPLVGLCTVTGFTFLVAGLATGALASTAWGA